MGLHICKLGPRSVDEQKRIDQFQKLDPPQFDSDPTANVQDFLDRCHEILRTLVLLSPIELISLLSK